MSEFEEDDANRQSQKDGSGAEAPPRGKSSRRWGGPLSPADIQIYRATDDLTGMLVYAMVVFSPWAFGTTQPWSVWVMNIGGYLLGLLLTVKLWIRWWKGYSPSRWQPAGSSAAERGWLHPGRLSTALAGVTIAILAYTLVSAVNARATYLPYEGSFEYHKFIPWLPHSLDSALTWFSFWQYLGLACAFWAVHDWLLGKSGTEERVVRQTGVRLGRGPAFPARLRSLLWVLAVNGALLGLEGIAQRLEGSGKLLFLVKPRVNPEAGTQFGPYAYRSNASQYFNLIWPICLGFWWTLHRSSSNGRSGSSHHLLLFCATIMAACPIISTSRGGAIVTVGIAVLSALFLLGAQAVLSGGSADNKKSRRLASLGILLFLVASMAIGFSLGWTSLKPRLPHMGENYEGREQMYDRARPMAADYPWFGTGPGTFKTVFQLYRFGTDTYWPAQLHNDWLETRITFGWVGSALIAMALLLVLSRWFVRGGIHGGRRFIVLTWMALAGCFVHARWDLPFQIHSIVFLFLLISAVLFSVSRRANR